VLSSASPRERNFLLALSLQLLHPLVPSLCRHTRGPFQHWLSQTRSDCDCMFIAHAGKLPRSALTGRSVEHVSPYPCANARNSVLVPSEIMFDVFVAASPMIDTVVTLAEPCVDC